MWVVSADNTSLPTFHNKLLIIPLVLIIFFQELNVNILRIVTEEGHCQSIYRISDYTRSFIKDESPTRL